ncbi:putative ribonuclease H-like superfamily, exonuclease, RNase T/DNA polymerase III [Arabidopsis thaliana]
MLVRKQVMRNLYQLCNVCDLFDGMSERDWNLFIMDDPAHLEIFNHDCSKELRVAAADLERKKSQEFNFFLVIDLEGKVEILEFPILIVDAKTMEVVDLFHRFVRPTKMSEQAINKYIEGKYGELGVDRVWHDTAIPFKQVVEEFEVWLAEHDLWDKDTDGGLNDAAFVTCGNWDIKTKIPEQCVVSNINLPPYFMEWINLKDVYLNFYGREARGMVSMMRQCGIKLMGSHHLGIDDTKNITRVVQRMLSEGAVLKLTARRSKSNMRNVEFLFKNRIK